MFRYWGEVMRLIYDITLLPVFIVLLHESGEHWSVLSLLRLDKLRLALETNFIDFLRNKMIMSRKKLHIVCILTWGYQYTKEGKILFFQLCRFMFDFCTNSLLHYLLFNFIVISTNCFDICNSHIHRNRSNFELWIFLSKHIK